MFKIQCCVSPNIQETKKIKFPLSDMEQHYYTYIKFSKKVECQKKGMPEETS